MHNEVTFFIVWVMGETYVTSAPIAIRTSTVMESM